ncbi:MAG TPA: hypothetical protein VHG72_14775, partial [Polyangia bacterium]|nr:hypothetical protein [Polyangia bacterium]
TPGTGADAGRGGPTSGAAGAVATGGTPGTGGAPGSGGAPGTGGTRGGAGNGDAGGRPAGAGGQAGGAGHASTGGAGQTGMDAGRDVSSTTAFSCSLVIGNSTTQQWFEGGFLTYPGIDPTRWEMFFVAHHYIDAWADPTDSAWTTALDMGHACAHGATTPDRVIFIVTYAPPYPAESTYETDTTSIVRNIQTKYPGVERIELMTLVRSPGNVATACSTAANNEQSIPAAEDQGIAAVAANPTFAGVVVASPPFYVPTCADFVTDKPQYTTAGATDVAKVYGAYYAAHP